MTESPAKYRSLKGCRHRGSVESLAPSNVRTSADNAMTNHHRRSCKHDAWDTSCNNQLRAYKRKQTQNWMNLKYMCISISISIEIKPNFMKIKQLKDVQLSFKSNLFYVNIFINDCITLKFLQKRVFEYYRL